MYCTAVETVVSILACICNVIISAFMVRFMIKFVSLRRSGQKFGNTMYRLSNFLFALIMVCMVSNVIRWMTTCFVNNRNIIFGLIQIGVTFYLLQYLVLFWLLFYRLDNTFRETEYKLSKALRRSFYSSYIMTLVLAVALIITTSSDSELSISAFGLILIALFFLAAFMFIVILIGSFIYKLVTVNKAMSGSCEESDIKFHDTIIRTCVLSIFSMASLFMFVCVVISRSASDALAETFGGRVFESLISSVDLLINFLSIIMGFTAFKAEYRKVFGVCHSLFTKQREDKIMMNRMTSGSVGDTTTADLETTTEAPQSEETSADATATSP